VRVNFEDGSATLEVEDQSVFDFGSIPNALNNGTHVTATVSYAITWHTIKKRRQVHNSTLHVAGTFLDTDARIEWSGRNANGFHFTASSHDQQAVIAQLGHERNGVFFDDD
jgi:hypothetical protein